MSTTYTTRVFQKGEKNECTATVKREGENDWQAFVLLPQGFYKANGRNPTEALNALAIKADLSHVGKLERY